MVEADKIKRIPGVISKIQNLANKRLEQQSLEHPKITYKNKEIIANRINNPPL
jgi:hypothetical protein